MTKAQLINEVAKQTGLSKADSRKAVESVFSIIQKVLAGRGERRVAISGFGILSVRRTKPRMGRNPATGEPIQIPAKTRIRFTPAKSLKEAVLKK